MMIPNYFLIHAIIQSLRLGIFLGIYLSHLCYQLDIAFIVMRLMVLDQNVTEMEFGRTIPITTQHLFIVKLHAAIRKSNMDSVIQNRN